MRARETADIVAAHLAEAARAAAAHEAEDEDEDVAPLRDPPRGRAPVARAALVELGEMDFGALDGRPLADVMADVRAISAEWRAGATARRVGGDGALARVVGRAGGRSRVWSVARANRASRAP